MQCNTAEVKLRRPACSNDRGWLILAFWTARQACSMLKAITRALFRSRFHKKACVARALDSGDKQPLGQLPPDAWKAKANQRQPGANCSSAACAGSQASKGLEPDARWRTTSWFKLAGSAEAGALQHQQPSSGSTTLQARWAGWRPRRRQQPFTAVSVLALSAGRDISVQLDGTRYEQL